MSSLFSIRERNGFRVVSLSDGQLIREAVSLINAGEAEGMNINFTRNFLADLNPLESASNIKFLAVNDYDHRKPYDYDVIHQLKSLRSLSIYTTDKKEIDFTAFPNLEEVALMWRPKAASLFECTQLKRLFLGKYNGHDLQALHKLTNLIYFRLNTGSVRSLRGIESMQKLEDLWLMQATKLVEIEGLSHLKFLKKLWIDNCKNIKDIQVLTALKIPAVHLLGTTPR